MAAMLCNQDISDYLKGVKFKKKGESGDGVDICEFDTTGELIKKLFSDKVFNFDDAKAKIKSAVEGQCTKKLKRGKTGWVQCSGPCFKVLHKYSKEELKSTAFILRLLAKSMIDITKTKQQIESGDDGKEVTVIYDGKLDFSEITGHWMRDKKHGDMEHFTIDIKHDEPRLIMALGPSSAGKTFSGTTVMKMIKKAKNDFPIKFLSIDGGIYREESIVYQTILESLKRYPDIIGFKDLVSPNKWEEIKHGTIFSSGTAKKEIAAWLKSRNVRISLYIPETLGAPAALVNPYNKIKKYVNITGDSNWIGLLIWQHLNDEAISKKKKNKIGKWKVMCDFPDGQKCKGTVPLGTKRQEGEGKIYDSGAWLNSMINGKKMIKRALGLIAAVHNSGQPGKKSTIKEYPLKNGSYVFNKELVERNNMVYEQEDKLPEESDSGPETDATKEVLRKDYPEILMVKRGPENASGPVDMFINRKRIAAGGKRTRKRKRKRKRTKRKKRRKRKKGTKRRKKRTRRR